MGSWNLATRLPMTSPFSRNSDMLSNRVLAVLAGLLASCAATARLPPAPPAQTPAAITATSPAAPPSIPLDLAAAYQRYLGPDRSSSIPGFHALAASWPPVGGTLNPDPKGPTECNLEVSPSSTRRSGDGAWIAVEGKEGVAVLDATTMGVKRFVAIPGSLTLQDEIPGTPLLVLQQHLPDEEHVIHLLVVDLQTGDVVETFDTFAGSPLTAVGPGKLAYVTTSAWKDPRVVNLHVWDALSDREIVNVRINGTLWMAFFEDGDLLAANVDGHVRLWELPPSGNVRDWTTPEGFYGSPPQMQPGGTLLAYPHERGVTLVDTNTHLTVATSNACPDESKNLSWSSDGTLLAVGAGLHACILEVPSLRLKVKTPDLRARWHSVLVEDGATSTRFIASRALMVRAVLGGKTKVFSVPSMKTLWAGATDYLGDDESTAGGLVMTTLKDATAPGAAMSIVTIDPDGPDGSLKVTERFATPEETSATAQPPEVREHPRFAAARMASATVRTLHGHVVPREVCGAPSPAPPPPSSSDAGPYTALLDLLDAEHVGYATGSESGFYVEAEVRLLCLPVHGRRAEGQPRTLACWEWPHELPRVEGSPYPEYDSTTQALTKVTVHAGDATVVLKGSSTKDGATALTISSVRVRATTKKSRLVDSLDYTMPPSRRPRPLPDPSKPGPPGLNGVALASAHGAHAESVAHALESFNEVGPYTRIRSAEYAGTSLVSLSRSNDADFYDEVWACQRGNNVPRACLRGRDDGDTRLGNFTALDPEKTLPGGWLVLAKDSYTPRGAESALVWVSVHEGVLKSFEIDVGGVGGIGSHCDPGDGEGYCVSMSGTWTPFDLVAPDCVHLKPSTHWSAVHDRVGDRWLHETIDPAADTDPAPGTYRPGPDGWKRQACASSGLTLTPPSPAP
jgi:hypothetical protein